MEFPKLLKVFSCQFYVLTMLALCPTVTAIIWWLLSTQFQVYLRLVLGP
jgi:hypothetical protein